MRILAIILALIFISVVSFSQQKTFVGSFSYHASISYADTSLLAKEWKVKIYTNDTIVRVETETGQFGTQI